MMESTDNIERRELLADLLEDDEPLTNSSAEEFKVYKRRWFMLAVVSLLNVSNAMVIQSRTILITRLTHKICMFMTNHETVCSFLKPSRSKSGLSNFSIKNGII